MGKYQEEALRIIILSFYFIVVILRLQRVTGSTLENPNPMVSSSCPHCEQRLDLSYQFYFSWFQSSAWNPSSAG